MTRKKAKKDLLIKRKPVRRFLPNDAVLATSIRRCLAANIHSIAKLSTAKVPDFIEVLPSKQLYVTHKAATRFVSAVEVMAFAHELNDAGLIRKFAIRGFGVALYPTNDGFEIFKAGQILLKLQSMTAPTSPTTRVDAKSAFKQSAITGSSSAASATLGSVPLSSIAMLPTAQALLDPILRATGRAALTAKELMMHLASEFSIPESHISLPIPLNTNQTLSMKVLFAIRYLACAGLVEKTGKRWVAKSITRPSPEHKGTTGCWPQFKEPKLRNTPTLIPNLPPEARQAHYSANPNVQRIVAILPTMEMHGLVSIWQNATRTLANPAKKQSHPSAEHVLAEISVEWDRRAKLGRPEDYFKWPSAEARGGNGQLTMVNSLNEGMLSYLEYRVGKQNGLHTPVRQSILCRIFEGSLPPVFDPAYMADWGANKSANRLHKMADSIAAFARNAKHRRDERLDEAIKEWEADLKFLHDRYYIGRFGFGWPNSKVK